MLLAGSDGLVDSAEVLAGSNSVQHTVNHLCLPTSPASFLPQGLTYSLVFAEALLAPAIPSVAARAGGLFLPLAKALCLACGTQLFHRGRCGVGAASVTCVATCRCIAQAPTLRTGPEHAAGRRAGLVL